MKILIVDTYYPAFLASRYRERPDLAHACYVTQLEMLLGQNFGTSDFYSRHLRALGCDARELIVNCLPLQSAWMCEAGRGLDSLLLRLSPKVRRLPGIGRALARLPALHDAAVAQIHEFRPDVLYCQDLSFFPPGVLAELKNEVGLIAGQIACPLPPDEFLVGYDLILTSFPHFVGRLRAKGVASEYFRLGFDPSVLDALGSVPKDVAASFVGGISSQHGKALTALDHLAETTPIQIFGYGADSLARGSLVRARHRGEVWGMAMYRALARSRVTVNRHIDVAQNFANNMRLYEASGVGTLLITDYKDNLGELFEIGKEILCYSSKEEAAELINYYLVHEDEANQIARAGQERTLSEHTYRHRMAELLPILERHLSGKR